MKWIIAILLAAVITGGCAPHEILPPAKLIGESNVPQIKTTLYFGLSMADGSIISQHDWDQFVDQEIASRFPDGFTILTAEGHWRSQAVNKREPSRVVIIVHPDTRFYDELIDVIRERYKTLFHQESVLREDVQPRDVCF